MIGLDMALSKCVKRWKTMMKKKYILNKTQVFSCQIWCFP